jgi:DNA-binding MarR family transcriptional regulator
MSKVKELPPQEWAIWHAWMHAHRLLAQELERRLQAELGISKAEFSILVTLRQAPTPQMRVLDLATSLGWDKSRVAHLLTRMEARSLVHRMESGASGRRTGIRLTAEGRRTSQRAITAHGNNVRMLFFDALSPEEASVIRAWSERTIEALTS